MQMKKIGMQMSLLMGVTLSFCLSLTGILSSGNFTIPGFLISFLISTLISLVIGFLIPMKKVSDSVCKKLKLQPGKLSARCVESLVSDLIYTPIITLCMVAMAHRQAASHGKVIPFLPMFGKSLLVSMLVGFVLIFFFMPFYLKLLMKKNGIRAKEQSQ